MPSLEQCLPYLRTFDVAIYFLQFNILLAGMFIYYYNYIAIFNSSMCEAYRSELLRRSVLKQTYRLYISNEKCIVAVWLNLPNLIYIPNWLYESRDFNHRFDFWKRLDLLLIERMCKRFRGNLPPVDCRVTLVKAITENILTLSMF